MFELSSRFHFSVQMLKQLFVLNLPTSDRRTLRNCKWVSQTGLRNMWGRMVHGVCGGGGVVAASRARANIMHFMITIRGCFALFHELWPRLRQWQQTEGENKRTKSGLRYDSCIFHARRCESKLAKSFRDVYISWALEKVTQNSVCVSQFPWADLFRPFY